MKIIESIRIKYFRSILTTNRGNQPFLQVNDLNIIVGSNDAGKSNFLKALNLFFNNSAGANEWSFLQEFSRQRIGKKREESRIEIELIINPPKKQYFKNHGQVSWAKVWYPNSARPNESIKYLNGKKFTNNNKSSYYRWLKKIRFRYVPAIKSKRYFDDLMYTLYDVYQTDTKNLEAQFNSQVRENTNIITQEISARLGIESVLQFKGNFRDLFLNLEFGSLDGSSLLTQRGDGIQVRHIPVILQGIAEAELSENRKREPAASTIWGFEEPENNLEFHSAMELANSFVEYLDRTYFGGSKYSDRDEGIQIFLTTHSPVFYTLAKTGNQKISSFLVKKNSDGSSSIQRIQVDRHSVIEDEMKLAPLVELSERWRTISKELKEKNSAIVKIRNHLETFTNNHEYIFLTEDKGKDLIKTFLKSNGFVMDKVDIRSYEGCTKIDAAKVLHDYLKDKFNEFCPTVIVHRDRDYLPDEVISKQKQNFHNEGIKYFVTTGTDLESHFLDINHLVQCNSDVKRTELEVLRNEAISQNHEVAIDYLRKQEFGDRHAKKPSHLSPQIEELVKMKSDRYFHGKKTLKTLRKLFQDKFGKNLKVNCESKFLMNEILKDLVLDKVTVN